MRLPSAEDVRKGHGRLTYQEALSLISLPDKVASGGQVIKRYMSRRSAWVPAVDFVPLAMELGISSFKSAINTYGGHVYSQAGLAASLSFRAAQERGSNGVQDREFGIHTIHGFFSEAGRSDRPFIYEVTNLASNASFPNFLVTVRQPTLPSTNPEGDYYPKEDADLPLGPVCFSAMISFRRNVMSSLSMQELSPQVRFAEILNSRGPAEWDPAPIADIEGILSTLPGARQAAGMFPGLELRKVDMRAYNTDRPVHERRELILHRLLAPLPATAGDEKVKNDQDEDNNCAIDGPNAHICAHAFAVDRNGLLMIGNHIAKLKLGHEVSSAASLSYSFVVHVGAKDAVMTYDEGHGQWWVQEACFPRVQAGRGIVHSKIWSPQGVHVATMYQDGIIRMKSKGDDEGKGKL
ncbi:thioesterase-like superfamily-domain-containing protein [Xylaria sp. FL1777]|nr:thioesterase-like superfamily-domain-containing protein [Xylaria sp. FL1777]